MLLQIDLTRDGTLVGNITVDEYVELGRRDKTDIGSTVPFTTRAEGYLRWVIADTGGANKTPRKVCGIEPIGRDRVKISNIHASNKELGVLEGNASKTRILPSESIERELPVRLFLPEGIEIQVQSITLTEDNQEGPAANPVFEDQVKSILGSASLGASTSGSSFSHSNSNLNNLSGTSHTVFSQDLDPTENSRLFLQAMRSVIPALQEPIDSPSFFKGIAAALIRVMDMDRVEIVTRRDGKWVYEEQNQHIRSKSIEPELPSRSLLDKVLASGKLSTYPDDGQDGTSESLMEMQTAIASPLFDPSGDEKELLGVLYADRRYKMGSRRSASITNDEKE
ncbi:MAG: hypothetical protein ACKOAU_15845, partial [Pirellula sp.]